MLQSLINKVKSFFSSPIEIDPSNLELAPLPHDTIDPEPFLHLLPLSLPLPIPWHVLTTQEKLMRILDRNYEAMDENSYRPVSLLSRFKDWQNAKTNEQRKMYAEILEDAIEYYLQYH